MLKNKPLQLLILWPQWQFTPFYLKLLLFFMVLGLLASCSNNQQLTSLKTEVDLGASELNLTPTLLSDSTQTKQPAKTPSNTPLTADIISITANVLAVEPPGNLIILEKRTEGFRVIALEDTSELVALNGTAMTLKEMRSGMKIQATGRHGEDNLMMIAQRVVVLADPPLTVTPRPPQPLPAPPTSVALTSVSSEWTDYAFPELGIMLSMPTDWEKLRMEESYFFAPILSVENGQKDLGRTQLTVGHQGNAPTELAAMSEFLVQNWHDLTPRSEFYTQSIVVDGYEGLAFWELSIESCVDIYVPAHGAVYALSFLATFCNEPHTQLNEVGQMILDSIQLSPPAN